MRRRAGAIGVGIAAAIFGLLMPGLAMACPVCGANEPSGWGLLALVGGMIAVPYLVAVVAIKAIRRIDRDSAWPVEANNQTAGQPEASPGVRS